MYKKKELRLNEADVEWTWVIYIHIADKQISKTQSIFYIYEEKETKINFKNVSSLIFVSILWIETLMEPSRFRG